MRVASLATAGRRMALGAWLLCAAAILQRCAQTPAASSQGKQAAPSSPASNLAPRVATLELRIQRIQDINAIKRLQRAYGYYHDEGQWDDVADLFADNASIEIGNDGVYRGREHIRQYFRVLGNGHNGLAPGQLNEHIQEMPVITLAADGKHANGTWRAIILDGQLGKEAWWSEGPYENQYVKENGVWKIASLHWFQTLRVPYDGGWAKNSDTNGAKFVGDRLKADGPSTVQYKTWPGAFTPPFHFRGQYPGLSAVAPPTSNVAASNQQLAARLATLSTEAERLGDQDDIENLQRIYGFYLDKGLWSEATALLTDDAELEIQGRGIYRGKDHILAYLRAVGPEGITSGRLYDHMLLQPVTHVDARGQSALGRWHVFAQLALAGKFHEWETGVMENEYRHEGRAWKIKRLHFYPTMITPYEQGWGKASLASSRFEPSLAPDAPSKGPSSSYETSFVTPFHYAHPVRSARAAAAKAAPANNAKEPLTLLEATERRIDAIEDRASIENIQTAYGYYLATLLWDDLTNLFAENGTIEIALRGVYVGKPAVRRNLNLYGQAGLDDGVLHNHMQFQMVIHAAPDGRTANLRSRALSMMGNAGRNATWMGGTYENEFEKINGRWYFHRDHQINTYFAPYETGWKDLPQRAAPGITDSNPPDRPPSFQFDMYPKNSLAPFHYVNPVTRKPYETKRTGD